MADERYVLVYLTLSMLSSHLADIETQHHIAVNMTLHLIARK